MWSVWIHATNVGCMSLVWSQLQEFGSAKWINFEKDKALLWTPQPVVQSAISTTLGLLLISLWTTGPTVLGYKLYMYSQVQYISTCLLFVAWSSAARKWTVEGQSWGGDPGSWNPEEWNQWRRRVLLVVMSSVYSVHLMTLRSSIKQPYSTCA